jgi:hypothetical protein
MTSVMMTPWPQPQWSRIFGFPTERVQALLSGKAVRPVSVQGRQLVSLREMDRAVVEGDRDPS